MKISDDYRHILVDEFRYVAGKIREGSSPVDKSYFLSACHGMTYRILNLEFSSELLLIHNVLQLSHQSIHTRAVEAMRGQNPQIPVLPEVFDAIADGIEALAAAIADDEGPYPALERINAACYVGTGNGYYLFQKGTLSLRGK